MTNIFMSGCCGRMGRAIYNMTKNSENFRIVAGSDLSDNTDGLDFPVYKDIFDCKEDFDAIIDFSHFKAVPNVCKYAIEHKKALVLCTTALDEPALAAAEKLAADGIDAKVINIHTIKPLDEDLVITAAKECGKVVTVEEHSVIGGLGSAVCDVLSEECPTVVKKIGMQDKYGESGSAAALVKKYGLDGEGVYNSVKEFLK